MPVTDRNFFDAFAHGLLRKDVKSTPSVLAGDIKNNDIGFAVYRNNVRSSLSRALGEKFPALKSLVGDEFFRFLAHEFYHTHPPSSPLISEYGAAMPEFLEDFEASQDYPYLADIARLEIAWLEAYHAPDATPMQAAEVIAAADGEFENLAIRLHPSLRALSSPHPIASIWRRCQSETGQEKISLAGKEYVLIARPQREVIVRCLSPGAYAAVVSLHQGAVMADALTAGANTEPRFNPQDFFRQLFQFNIITETARSAQETGPSS